MFKRKITEYLQSWSEKKNRKPLILRGARQTGKTTVIHEFANNFDHYLYFNLEHSNEKELFEKKLPFDDFVASIFLFKNKKIKDKKTLIFIDEIQNSPNAVKQLRYFYEKRPDITVIAAGSLLETLLDKHISFPVGRVEYLYLHPFSFKEFLLAMNEISASQLLEEIPIPEYAHDKLLNLFHKYSLIGGMPEAIKTYIESGDDIVQTNQIYSSLFSAYLDDVEKYAKNEKSANIIRHTINTIPYESGKRIKFACFGKSNYSSKEIGEAMRILEKTMLIQLIRPATEVEIPAVPDFKKSPKLQFLDTGLINHINGLQQSIIYTKDLNSVYRGIITEHICAQELISLSIHNPRRLLFWTREKKQSNAEVDFIILYKEFIIPIEVKSGKQGTLRSLHQFINRAPHPYAVRLYNGPIKIDIIKTPEGNPYKLLNLPYYCTGKISEYLTWFVK